MSELATCQTILLGIGIPTDPYDYWSTNNPRRDIDAARTARERIRRGEGLGCDWYYSPDDMIEAIMNPETEGERTRIY